MSTAKFFPLAIVFALTVVITLTHKATADSNESLVNYVDSFKDVRNLRGHPNIPVPTKEDIQDVIEGELVVKKGDVNEEGLRFVWAAKLMDVPAVQYWLTIIDREHYEKLSENIVESFTFDVDGIEFLTYNVLEAPMVSTRHQVLKATVNTKLYEASKGKVWEHYWGLVPNAAKEVERALGLNLLTDIKKEDVEKAVVVKHNQGSWMMIGLPNGKTYAETYTINDPGGKIPDFIVRKVSTMATGRTFESYEGWGKDKVLPHIKKEHGQVMSPDGVWMSPKEILEGYPREVS